MTTTGASSWTSWTPLPRTGEPPTAASGSGATGTSTSPTPRSSAGPRSTAASPSPRPACERHRSSAGASPATSFARRSSGAATTRSAASSSRYSTRRASTPPCCAYRSSGSSTTTTNAWSGPLMRSGRSSTPTDCSTATGGRTVSREMKVRSSRRRSGWPRSWPTRTASPRRRRSSTGRLRPRMASVSSRRSTTPGRSACSGTSRRRLRTYRISRPRSLCSGRARNSAGLAGHSQLDRLRDMDRMPVRELLDLGPAAEAVGEDQALGRSLANGREESSLADRDGDVVLAGLEPERARQPATPGIEHLEVEAEALQELAVGVEPHDRLLMAVPVHDRASLKPWHLPVLRVLLQELRQRHRARRDPGRVLVVDEHRGKLVSERGHATRLEADDRHAGPRIRGETPDQPLQQQLRRVEHPVVVERPSTAEEALRGDHPKSRRLEHTGGCLRSIRMEVLVESVREEHDRR